jgi:WD40 repeat protein
MICWDTHMMQRAFNIGLGSYTPRFRSDGRECAVVIETPRRVLLHAFEPPAAHREFSEDLGVRLRSAAFSADGRWLAASGADRCGVWDLASGAPGTLTKGGDQTRVAFSKRDELFVYRFEECSRWQVMPGTGAVAPPRLEQVELDVPTGFGSVALLSNSFVLIAARGSQIRGLDPHYEQSGDWKSTVNGNSTVSPDGRWLAVHPTYQLTLFIYHLPDLELAAVLTNSFRIGPFHFSPRGNELAVGSQRGIEFWSTKTWQRTRVLTNFIDILYAPDVRSFWLTKDYNTAGLYDAESLQPLLPLPNGTLPLAVSPNGRQIALSIDMRRLQVWDLVEVRKRLRDLGLDWASPK